MLESWFELEATRRMALIAGQQASMSDFEIQAALEMNNRFPDGSMRPLELKEMGQIADFISGPKDILARAKDGMRLMSDNPSFPALGTVARGIPGGGTSSRASSWVRKNPALAAEFGLTEDLSRPLYRVGGKTLLQLTLENSRDIARAAGRIFPAIVMTNSETSTELVDHVRSDWLDWTSDELSHTILFNQIVLPRRRVRDGSIIDGKLYAAGHGDYPYLMGQNHIARTLSECGIKYLFFSNADEWLWQPDPVLVSIAAQLFEGGHHMLIMGTLNTNNQFGGGFVARSDGKKGLTETPRLPWNIVRDGKAPAAVNTTFYAIDVPYLASIEEELMSVPKSIVVKTIPSETPNELEYIFGVDSYAGDVFADNLNPFIMAWPRLNFLGIKDGSFIAGAEALDALGGRSYRQYVNEAALDFPRMMKRLMSGDPSVAEELFQNDYSYLPPVAKYQ